MKIIYHKELAKGKRYKLNFAKQMANIGGEVYRSFQAKNRFPERFDSALGRALELFDISLSDPKAKPSQRKELCRAREIFCDAVCGYNEYSTDIESFQKYFDDFALLKG